MLVLQIAAGIALFYAIAIVADYVMTERKRLRWMRYANEQERKRMGL